MEKGGDAENGETSAPGITLFGDDDTVVQDLAPALGGSGEQLESDGDEYVEEGEEFGEEGSGDQEGDENAWMGGESSADSADGSI